MTDATDNGTQAAYVGVSPAPYQGTPGPAVHCVNCNTTYTGVTMDDAIVSYLSHNLECVTAW